MNTAHNPAEMLIAAAAISPEIEAWISLQLKAGRRPSEILGLIGGTNVIPFKRKSPAEENRNA
ncbi:hypothetical protein [Mesorhizobium sp. M6A.T.Ce.TU.016.01.1.1]|uniref:hypothetical protein n=1 Tax=Mesorhizobium sp. M6A.T.Ce.TU.016.01.1.1 TaxID=2496783 RepID=UPI000FCAFCA6|nr:hypothetical protein [Mesorhizobium sp. M6A.T.Ce.TU.016.01.1.1]RUU29722.1 hypothetical protein EOC94_12690 [Mesorhizobium sp. M6A.T.Ce.TU.016.01.1.1]